MSQDLDKLVEYSKIQAEMLRHQDSLIWSRLSTFITIVAIIGGFFSVLLLAFINSNNQIIQNELANLIGVLSFIMLVIGIFWQILMERPYYYMDFHNKKGKYIQKVIRESKNKTNEILSFVFIDKTETLQNKFNLISKFRTIWVIRSFFVFGHELFFSLTLICLTNNLTVFLGTESIIVLFYLVILLIIPILILILGTLYSIFIDNKQTR